MRRKSFPQRQGDSLAARTRAHRRCRVSRRRSGWPSCWRNAGASKTTPAIDPLPAPLRALVLRQLRVRRVDQAEGRRPVLEQLRIPPTESEFRKRQLRNYHRCRSHPTRAVRPQAELRTQGERVPWNLSNVGSRRFSWMGAAVGNCKLIEAYCCFRSAFPAFPSRRSGSGCGRRRFSRERPSTLRSIRAGSAPGQMGGQGSAKRRDRQGPAVDWTRLGRGAPMAKVNLGFAGSK